MKLFALSSNRPLAEKIAAKLGIKLSEIRLNRFNDGEFFPEILENVRGQDIFLVQSTNKPANDNLMELLLAIDAAKRGSAKRITAVMPYFGYSRQDRKTSPRCPISAKVVANLITTAGADRVLTMDLHAGQIQGFFDIPVDNLFATPVFIPSIREKFAGDDLMIVSPDVGGVVRARAYATKLGTDLAIIDKRRPEAGVAEVMNIIGQVEGKTCIMVDDMVDSGGTLCKAADALIDKGAKAVYAFCTHGIFSNSALDKLEASKLKKLVVTESIYIDDGRLSHPKIEYVDISELIANAILRIHEERSVSTLFEISKAS
ncbi:MAG: phosphoribosylpyrophosphate synthetase [Rickettsiales bacterium]|nr:phosphoribosylpyrophosphate synthetase [Rickettsiales bacterium]